MVAVGNAFLTEPFHQLFPWIFFFPGQIISYENKVIVTRKGEGRNVGMEEC